MKQRAFEEKYHERWERFEAQLKILEPGSDLRFSSAGRRARAAELGTGAGRPSAEFPRLYREICRDLSVSAQRRYSPRLLDRLNLLALGGHRQLYLRSTDFLGQFVRFATMGFPQKVREHWRPLALASALFCLPALLIFLATLAHPELVYSVLSPERVREFEAMYDPSASHRLGTNRSAESDISMFGFYIANNIGVSFRTFATGILGGVGSAFFLVLNGLIIGALSAHVIHIEFADPFFSFVIGHGSVELTAIVISGGAGLMLGYALIAPGRLSRAEALRRAASESIQLIMGVIVMLVMAALLEAFWSSKVTILQGVKYGVGGCLWFAVFCYFTLAGRRREA